MNIGVPLVPYPVYPYPASAARLLPTGLPGLSAVRTRLDPWVL